MRNPPVQSTGFSPSFGVSKFRVQALARRLESRLQPACGSAAEVVKDGGIDVAHVARRGPLPTPIPESSKTVASASGQLKNF